MFTSSIPSAAQAFELDSPTAKTTKKAISQAKHERDAADKIHREYSESLLARLPEIIMESRVRYPGSIYIRIDSLTCTSNGWGLKPSRQTEVLVRMLKEAGYRTTVRSNGLPNERFEWEVSVYVMDPDATAARLTKSN